MSNALRFAFLEIARFNKRKEECKTFEDRFLYIMKNLPTFAEKPELWDDPYFEEMIQEAEFANMSFADQEAYIQAMKNRWDYKNTLDFAREEGKEEGREEGKIDVAKEMLAMGFEAAIVQQATGLSKEQVQSLQR